MNDPQIPQRMRRVCAGCQLVMDEGTPGAKITHGFCPPCELKQWEETGIPQSLWPARVVEFARAKYSKPS